MQRTNGNWELLVKGFADIAIGSACFAVLVVWCYGWDKFFPKGLPEEGFVNLFIIGYGTYMWYFLTSYGVFRLASGLGRWCGYPLPEPTYFPLLAATPQDRWRRWNIYMYEWFVGLFFIPSMRKINSPLLAILLTFTATAFVHILMEYCALPFEALNQNIVDFLRSQTLFFWAHGLVVYVALRTQKFWPSGRTRYGWLSVAVTHVLMAAVFFIIRN